MVVDVVVAVVQLIAEAAIDELEGSVAQVSSLMNAGLASEVGAAPVAVAWADLSISGPLGSEIAVESGGAIGWATGAEAVSSHLQHGQACELSAGLAFVQPDEECARNAWPPPPQQPQRLDWVDSAHQFVSSAAERHKADLLPGASIAEHLWADLAAVDHKGHL